MGRFFGLVLVLLLCIPGLAAAEAPVVSPHRPMIIVVHGVGGGNRPDGWSNDTVTDWGVPGLEEVTFRYPDRGDAQSYTDMAIQAGDWAIQVRDQIKAKIEANPGRPVMIVSHSWGSVATAIALAGGSGGGTSKALEENDYQVDPIRLDGVRIKEWITLGSPLGRAYANVPVNLRQLNVQVPTGRPAVVDHWSNFWDVADPVSNDSHNLEGADNNKVEGSGSILRFIDPTGVTAHTGIWTNRRVKTHVRMKYAELAGEAEAEAAAAALPPAGVAAAPARLTVNTWEAGKPGYGFRSTLKLTGGSASNRVVYTFGDAQEIEVPAGAYDLEAAAGGYLTKSQKIELRAGEKRTIDMELESGAAALHVTVLDRLARTELTGVTVQLAAAGGKFWRPSPATFQLFSEGWYTVSAASGQIGGKFYQGGSMQVQVAMGESKSVALFLDPEKEVVASPVPPAAIRLDPGYLPLNVGDRYEVLATVLDSNGQEIPDAQVSWESSAAGIASVDARGDVSGVSRGDARITARYGGQSASLPVRVESGAVLGVCRIVNAPKKLPARGGDVTLQLATEGTDGKPLPAVAVSWSGSNDEVALVNPTTGHVTTEKPGMVTVTALLNAAEGHEISCDADIEVEKRYATVLVSGQVVDAAGKPASGASAQAAGGTAVPGDATGRFTARAGGEPLAEGAEIEVKATQGSATGSTRAKVLEGGVVKDVVVRLGAAGAGSPVPAASDAINPVHLFRIWEAGKAAQADFLLYAKAEGDKGVFKFPDGNGGWYWKEGEDLGVYKSESAICAVLRGYGKYAVSYNLYAWTVQCPKEGPIAKPQSTAGGQPTAGAPPAVAQPPAYGSLAAGMLAFEMVVGDVRYYLDAPAEAKPLTPRTPIPSGATVVTGKDSRVSIRFPDKTAARLGENSTAKVVAQSEQDRQPELHLRQGGAEIETAPDFEGLERTGAGLRVQTPDVAITKEGTRYRVWVDETRTRVEVLAGKVALRGRMLARADQNWEAPGKRSFPQTLSLAAGERAIAFRGMGAADAGTGALPAALARPDPWNDAAVQQLLDQWLRTAVPPVDKPGVIMRYNEWAQPLSQAATSTGPPDHPADWSRYRYLWENRGRYTSTRLCTLGEYVERTLKGVSLADCVKAGGQTSAGAPAPAAVPAGGQSSPPSSPGREAAGTGSRAEPAAPVSFGGDWVCTLTNDDGRTSKTDSLISQYPNGAYVLHVQGGLKVPGRVLEGNKLQFSIMGPTALMTLTFERKGQGLVGTDHVKRQDGTENTYPMNCTVKPAAAGSEGMKKEAPRK